MRNTSTIRGVWGSAKRRWRAWRGRLWRDRAALALVAILSLAVFEPLLCIVHCQFWIPFALSSYFAEQHEHHHLHTHAAGAAPAPAPASTAAVLLGPGAGPAAGCTIHMGNPSGSPLSPPPSPVHETLPTLVLPIFIALLALAYSSGALTGPPRVFVPVPLRPPIQIAG